MIQPCSTEIHVPASPNSKFANMLFFLVHSLASHAEFRGSWKVVVTLGRDGDLTPESPEFAWSRNFPVEFRSVSESMWAEFDEEARRRKTPGFVYNATAYHQYTYDFAADAVVFMDADIVVLGPLAEVLDRVRQRDLLAAWPAWAPPPAELEGIIAARGLHYLGPPVTLSGYGWSFTEPRHVPPYFNYGFVACSNRVARLLGRHLPEDVGFVTAIYHGPFNWQIALCLAIIRHAIAFEALDERFNFGNGAATACLLQGEEGRRLEHAVQEAAADIRVLHYCVRTPHFDKAKVMGDDDAIRTFCSLQGLEDGEKILQSALMEYFDLWKARLQAAR